MKQNVKNVKQQRMYARRRTAFVVILLILLALVIAIYASTNSTNNVANNNNNLILINGGSIDISSIISNEPNAPAVGAGMIPIKWNGEKWEITSKDDSNWYNYSEGKWATVMLSDGYYKSEVEIGINENKQLAEKNIGKAIEESELGTIFTWVPRFCYNDTQIEFLKGTSIIEYKWTTESCFNYEKFGPKAIDLAYEGIWVGQKEFASATEVENKNSEMNTEYNKQGLIANERVATLTASDKKAVQKLYEKSKNEVFTPEEIEHIQNRQTIKIINANKRLPLMGAYSISDDSIVISAKYSENSLAFCLDKDGNKLNGNKASIDEGEITYTFYLVDNVGNVRRYKVNYGFGRPYLKGFNKSKTFYVLYDDNGVEDSSIPIGEKAPANWYSYENQRWANIVVRDNGNEIYYTWIPRYMYKLNAETETTDARFVDLENVWIDENGKEVNLNNTEYKLPEAFTWEDPDNANRVVQLPGFWASKYKLREGSTYNPDIIGLGGTINITGVVSTIGSSYTYEVYLINQDGKRIVKNPETGEYEEGNTPVVITGDYKFTKVPDGIYVVDIIVKDSTGKHIQGLARQATVLPRVEANAPDLTKYDINKTFYVTYDNNGNETSTIPIGMEKPANWYDYDEDIKATIVARENGEEKYYEWIPRYQCLVSDNNNLSYIATDKTEPDDGYTIPAEFTDSDGNAISGYWKEKETFSNRILANVAGGENRILITGISLPTGVKSYDMYLIQDGKIIKGPEELTEDSEGKIKNNHEYLSLAQGKYTVNIIAKNEDGVMLAGYTEEEVLFKVEVDFDGFNVNNTFYVAYDEAGNETSYIPIGEEAPENWYNYEEQKWANIVVRDNGQENYYAWIPRYEYQLNSGVEKANIRFIPKTATASVGYKIPEAFTWEDPDDANNVIQLSGFWASKYKLRDGNTINLDGIYGAGGKIQIDNIVSAVGSSYTYEAYLITNGKIVARKTITGNDKITKLDDGNSIPEGEYVVNIIVKDSTGKQVQGIAKTVTTLPKVQENAPDLTPYNRNTTCYVTYNNVLGVENDSTIPIGDAKPSNWYDYDEDSKATIVVRENGLETYYEWIPRYQCLIADNTSLSYISTDKTEPDAGYMIPDVFTGDKADGYWNEIQKYEGRMNANISAGKDKIVVSNITSSSSSYVTYKAYLVKNGKLLQSTTITDDTCTFTGLAEGLYGVHIVKADANGTTLYSYAQEVRVTSIDTPDLTGFNSSITYYVTYNDDGTEELKPITEAPPDNWYDYAEQKWANIKVVDENGITNYFTWIPRYEYTLNPYAEKTITRFIPKTQIEPSDGYKIPESFTWEDPADSTKVIQLSGFWASKYKLRE